MATSRKEQLPTDSARISITERFSHYDSGNYIWHEKLDDYPKDEIKDMCEEKVNFIYENGVAFLEQIYESIKIYQTRTAALVGYLLVLTSSLIGILMDGGFIIDSQIEYACLILAIVFFILMCFVCKLLLNQKTAMTRLPPATFLEKDQLKYDLKLMKIHACRTLQASADMNFALLQEISSKLKFYITIALFLSAATFANFAYLTSGFFS